MCWEPSQILQKKISENVSFTTLNNTYDGLEGKFHALLIHIIILYCSLPCKDIFTFILLRLGNFLSLDHHRSHGTHQKGNPVKYGNRLER